MERRQLDFDNAFSHGKGRSKIFAELPACLFSKHERENRVFKQKRSLYGLKNTALVLHDLLVSRFPDPWFHELENTPCVFKRDSLIVICYVDDLMVLEQTDLDKASSLAYCQKV